MAVCRWKYPDCAYAVGECPANPFTYHYLPAVLIGSASCTDRLQPSGSRR